MESDVIYTVDASDAITSVNDAWTAFARANDGSALVPPSILGRVLWDFIGDSTTRHLYFRLFERVREGIGPVRFAFRCDAPATRRLLEMTITAQPAGGLAFVTRPLTREDRPPVLLLDPHVPRSDALLRMCAWCKRIPVDSGEWMEIEEALPRLGWFEQLELPAISHGICADCERAMTTALEDPTRASSGGITLGGSPAPR